MGWYNWTRANADAYRLIFDATGNLAGWGIEGDPVSANYSPNVDFLDEFRKRQLTRYTGQSTRKSPQAGVGRSRSGEPRRRPAALCRIPALHASVTAMR